jgi:ATP-dependent phosphofructokinase / diphosphate-dependent phosphofructokinase
VVYQPLTGADFWKRLTTAALDLAAMSRTSTKVFTLEVIGRHAGWTTAACALAAEHESIAVSEGVKRPDGEFPSASGVKDSFGMPSWAGARRSSPV